MDFQEYQEKRRSTDKYYPDQKVFCHALGLGSEAGEYQGKVDKHYRKNREFDPVDDEREHMAKELGDVLWFLAACADDIGYSLEDIAEMNIAKLADRDKRNQIASIEGGDDR